MHIPSTLPILVSLAMAIPEHPERFTPPMQTLIREAVCATPKDEDRFLPRLRDMKNILLPDCALCPHPCGRTDDFDIATLTLETPVARALKEELIHALPALADRQNDHLLRALQAIGEYRYDHTLHALVRELLPFNEKDGV